MKDKIFGVLQRVGRSFMLPIAILPVAGLLLGLGSSFTNATTIATYGLQGILGEGTLLHSLLIIMNKVGSAIFDNLPLIFAVGVAIGMAKKEKEVAALSALIAYFVMHISINSMLEISGKIAADGTISKNVLEGTIASVCGINTLQMGVFGGIIVGLGVAAAECVIILRRFQIRTDHFNDYLYVRRNRNVFRMANRAERYLCTGWSGNRNGLLWNTDLRYCKTCTDPIRSAPCILSSILADSCRRNDGSRRKADSGRSEYLLRTAC